MWEEPGTFWDFGRHVYFFIPLVGPIFQVGRLVFSLWFLPVHPFHTAEDRRLLNNVENQDIENQQELRASWKWRFHFKDRSSLRYHFDWGRCIRSIETWKAILPIVFLGYLQCLWCYFFRYLPVTLTVLLLFFFNWSKEQLESLIWMGPWRALCPLVSAEQMIMKSSLDGAFPAPSPATSSSWKTTLSPCLVVHSQAQLSALPTVWVRPCF